MKQLANRIEEALDGTTPECPPVLVERLGEDRWLVEGDTLTVADARLILTAPTLLDEAMRRLRVMEAELDSLGRRILAGRVSDGE